MARRSKHNKRSRQAAKKRPSDVRSPRQSIGRKLTKGVLSALMNDLASKILDYILQNWL